MILERYVVGSLQTNCYLLGDEHTKKAFVIDPGGNADMIAGRLEKLALELVAIVNTHGHFDHVSGAWDLQRRSGGEIYLHREDLFLLNNRKTGLAALLAPTLSTPKGDPDRWLREGDELVLGNHRIQVLETPGHTPGHVSLYLPDDRIIFVGDTLFAGSIGRTDFPGGNYEALIKSVREKIFPLDGNTVVYPGHGPETTIANEKRYNPFFR